MKPFRPLVRFLLLAASLLVLAASPTSAADAKTEALKDHQDELEILKNRYTDEHPRVVEQKQRIAQLQRRIDEDQEQREKEREMVNAEVRKRRVARISGNGSTDATKATAPAESPIIRTEIRLLAPKAHGDFDVLAAPTLITQSGQEASLATGAYVIGLSSSMDGQSNIITTSVELTINGSDGKPAEKIKFPSVKNRPGTTSTVSVEDRPTVEIRATLVDPKGISIDFPGGSLAAFLGAVADSGSEPFNMIAPNDALALRVPQISVRNVTPRNLALALDQLLDGYLVDFPKGVTERDGAPVFTIRANPLSGKAETKADKPNPERFMSYPINRYVLDQIPIDHVIEAINAAWKLDPANKSEDLKPKYHAATGILLVSSREETALKTAHQVIDSLQVQAQYLADKMPKAFSPPAPKP